MHNPNEIFSTPDPEQTPEYHGFDPAVVETSSLTSEQIDLIRFAARETAQEFVDEHEEPLDPLQTDWDAEAWERDQREIGLADLDGVVASSAWRLYQAELATETRRLCEAT